MKSLTTRACFGRVAFGFWPTPHSVRGRLHSLSVALERMRHRGFEERRTAWQRLTDRGAWWYMRRAFAFRSR
jgi:hypothetical protein